MMVVGIAQGVFSDDVDVAEAEALCFGLRLVRKIGLSLLMVELDSLCMIN